MEIISKKEALNKGLKTYFTGKPCKHGHTSERYVSSRCCVDCQEAWRIENKETQLEYFKNRYEENKSVILVKAKEYRDQNKEIISLKHKKYHEQNREKIIARVKKFCEENKKHVALYQKNYRAANKSSMRVRSSERRARQKNATVNWANAIKIKQVYEECEKKNESTGIEHHVDHIVPLTHKLVCGLHNEFNLQVLTKKENLTKKNCYWPDMPDDIYEALKFYYHE